MKIEQTVEVDAPLERVWELVNDVPRVAPCMPGAALTNVIDDRTYEGTVQVKLGPIRMSYKGTVVLEEVNDAEHWARLSAKGRDVKGSGTAQANVRTQLESVDGNRTRMTVSSDVQLTGKVASFGRGAVQDVAAKLFGQFAQCLRDSLQEEAAPAGETTAAQAEPAPAATGGSADTQAAPSAATTSPAPAPSAGTSRRPAQQSELEVGGLIGTVVTGRVKAAAETATAFARGLRVRMSRRR